MRITIGAEDELVREVQERLQEHGFDPGEIDGVLDENTRTALVNFQLERGLSADGAIAEPTLDDLGVDTAEVEEEFPTPEEERAQFKQLIAKNSNYFGNLPDADVEPTAPLAGDTSYEELTCVGYAPELQRLEAVVHVKREYGYGGDICSQGTPEYVRFYVDWDDTGNWTDVGMADFRAYNVPGDKPLEYGVSLELDPDEEWCITENLPEVRAILSWHQRPPKNTPNFVPVWGNVLESRIQIDTSPGISLDSLLDRFDVALPEQLATGVDTSQLLSFEAQSLSLSDLADEYEETSVPAHRFGFQQLSGLTNDVTAIDEIEVQSQLEPLKHLDIDVAETIDSLFEEDGETYYEELDCVGLTRAGLNATVTVKRPDGYLGGLCSDGSHEHVAFWEWDPDTSQWNHLGTASVNVHDIDDLPSGGLKYATLLPTDFGHRQQACEKGPSLVRVRATLSWEEPPPPADPYWTPRWGNSMETLVHVPPGPDVEDGVPQFGTIGSMTPCQIDQSTGLASGPAQGTANFTANESPFGRTVTITGRIVNPAAFPRMKYRVRVRPYTSSGKKTWRPVQEEFDLRVYQGLTETEIEQTTDADGFYTYQEDLPQRWVPAGKLAEWPTHDKEGLWEIELQAKEQGEAPVSAPTITCPDGTTRDTVVVRLDNTQPEASIKIEKVEHPDGSFDDVAEGECGNFDIGDKIHGTYEGTDKHFRDLSLTVSPSGPANNTKPEIPSPRLSWPSSTSPPSTPTSSRSYPTLTTGESGTWVLDTTTMSECGYIAHVNVDDRTIVNSGGIGYDSGDSVGFCVLKPSTEADGGTATTTAELSDAQERSGPVDTAKLAGEASLGIADFQFDAPGDDHRNLNEEYVAFENTGDTAVDLTGWRVEDDAGESYDFPDGFTLTPGASVTLHTGQGENTERDVYWGLERAVWDNTGDSVFLYDPTGELVLKESY